MAQFNIGDLLGFNNKGRYEGDEDPLDALLRKTFGDDSYNTPPIKGPEEVGEIEEMFVTAPTRTEAPRPVVDPVPPVVRRGPQNLNNIGYIQERDDAEAELAEARKNGEVSQRKGMFGVKGTLRDVIGALGDAFLVGHGGEAAYAPQRQRERISDAMAGYTDGEIEAIERVAGVDPALAQKMYDQYQSRTIQNAQLQRQQEATNSQVASRRASQAKDANKLVLDGIHATRGNPAAQTAFLARIQEVYPDIVDQLLVNADTDPAVIEALSAVGTMTSNQQANLPLAERKVSVAERNAKSNETRANRPPQGRAAPQPTEAAEVTRIRGAVNRGEKLGAGDQATWDKYVSGGKKGRGSRTLSIPGSTGDRSFTVTRK